MQYEDKIALSKVRLEKAEDCFNDAKALIKSGGYKSSANRSYYAVFHAMRAVLVFDDLTAKNIPELFLSSEKDI